MSNLTLSKYRGVTPVNDIAITDAMLRVLVDLPPQQQRWINDAGVGAVCVYEDERFPKHVLEYVMGTQQDSVTTLYLKSPEFESLSRLRDSRKDLIDEIGRVLMAIPSSVQVRDSGRERNVGLAELGTAQLIDTLAHFTGRDLLSI